MSIRSCFVAAGFAVFLMGLASAGTLSGDEVSSRNNERLARGLKEFPESDANKDGVLTMEEANAWQARRAPKTELQVASGSNNVPERFRMPEPTHRDVAYGSLSRQKLDFWAAAGTASAPVIVYFHGGGFVDGDKDAPGMLKEFLKAGYSVASVRYRLVRTDPLPAAFLDGARAVQFLRSQSQAWQIDAGLMLTHGISSGGVIALWIGFHDDLADAASKDPVTRQSSRVSGVIGWLAQTTLDPELIEKHVYADPWSYGGIRSLIGLKPEADLRAPEVLAWFRELSPLTLATADDPPVFLGYGNGNQPGPFVLPKETPVEGWIHNGRFGVILKEKLDKLGVFCHGTWASGEAQSGMKELDFLRYVESRGRKMDVEGNVP